MSAEITTVPGYDTYSTVLWAVKTRHTWEYHVNECHWCIWKCNVSSFDDQGKTIYSFHPFPPNALNQPLFFTKAKQLANLFLCHPFRKRDLFTDSPTDFLYLSFSYWVKKQGKDEATSLTFSERTRGAKWSETAQGTWCNEENMEKMDLWVDFYTSEVSEVDRRACSSLNWRVGSQME